jgi:hypothetical protein
MSEQDQNLPEVLEAERSPAPMGGGLAVQESKAIQEVQAKLIMARKFPRDMARTRARILEECKSLTLAEKAQWKYPRGGKILSGPSIRLAEVIARNYGNMTFGVRELERRNGSSLAQAFCWDLESNTSIEKDFEVPHEMKAGNKLKRLTDPRDIYEIVANNGARRMRAAILGMISISIIEDAEAACRATLVKGGGIPIETRLAKMLMAFKELGVSPEMIEEKLGHKIDVTIAEEIVDLTAIYNSIKDGKGRRGDFFNFPEDAVDEEAAKIADKIASMGNVEAK